MKKNIFKTLSYLGEWVDYNLLEKGIYITSKPHIFDEKATIESLIQQGKMMKDMTGNNFISDSYFKNLEKCKLINIEIKEVNND